MNRIILALDTTNLEEAISITSQIKDKIFTVKLGLEFFNSCSKSGIKKFNNLGINNLMLDLKLQDIPATINRSILALKGIKFGYLTVMALGGNEMIKQAKNAANELDPNIKILAVTILTSISQNELSRMGANSSIEDMVIQLAKNSNDADGYVASPLEARILREKVSKDKLIFCPGIRMPDDKKDDQVRTATPTIAFKNGADAIIMGRSLIKGNIEENLKRVLASLKV